MKVTVVKVGGAIVEDTEALAGLLARFEQVEGMKLLVHGGGRTATDVASRLGVETRMVEGRRVTDAETLKVVTMVYAGLVNKQVVAELVARGVPALGLTGADMDVIRSNRRPPKNGVDYGFVGDPVKVDGARLCRLMESGIVPVMCALTHDGNGTMLNTNADTIAGEVAKGIAAEGCEVELVYCFEHAGVLRDPNDEGSLIAHIDAAAFEGLKADGTVSGGMLPKITNCLQAVEAGVKRVRITSVEELAGGTVIY